MRLNTFYQFIPADHIGAKQLLNYMRVSCNKLVFSTVRQCLLKSALYIGGLLLAIGAFMALVGLVLMIFQDESERWDWWVPLIMLVSMLPFLPLICLSNCYDSFILPGRVKRKIERFLNESLPGCEITEWVTPASCYVNYQNLTLEVALNKKEFDDKGRQLPYGQGKDQFCVGQVVLLKDAEKKADWAAYCMEHSNPRLVLLPDYICLAHLTKELKDRNIVQQGLAQVKALMERFGLTAIRESEIPRPTLSDECYDLMSGLEAALSEECELSHLSGHFDEDNLEGFFRESYEKCSEAGFLPVLIRLNNNLLEDIQYNKDKVHEPVPSARQYLKDALDRFKNDYADSETDWENNFVGKVEEGTFDTARWLRVALDGEPGEKACNAVVCIPGHDAGRVFQELCMGHFNDCPNPVQHAAVARYWQEEYGALPCFITSDIIVYYVPQPVGKDRAMQLAEEHMAYCTDIIMQGNWNISTLAHGLQQSHFWYFWWD